MKRTIRMENLDCANCAAKMEAGISKLPGVNKATISFMTQKLLLDAQDDLFDEVLREARKICQKVEPDCILIF